MAIHVVAGVTSRITIALRDRSLKGWPPVDVSGGQTTATLRVKRRGATSGTDVPCAPLPGLRAADGSIDASGQWATPGAGGLVMAECGPSVFSEPGAYEGEIAVSFGALQLSVAAFSVLHFTCRPRL